MRKNRDIIEIILYTLLWSCIILGIGVTLLPKDQVEKPHYDIILHGTPDGP